jgi:hypothetical protein
VAWDRSTPIGPLVVSAAQAGGIEPDLAISGHLNATAVQDSRTSDLIFGIPVLVAYLTTIMSMEPGDLVLTGTPSGVGFACDPLRSLQDGDVSPPPSRGSARSPTRSSPTLAPLNHSDATGAVTPVAYRMVRKAPPNGGGHAVWPTLRCATCAPRAE